MRFVFRGVVQGVGFRPAVCKAAVSAGLRGSVWNEGSDVIVDVDDGAGFEEAFCAGKIPPLARIDSVEKIEYPVDKGIAGFSILGSADGRGAASIPPDTAVCGDCLKDMFGGGSRGGYAFTTCTNCGPRFTLLSGMPYDRSRTSMSDFAACPACAGEYSDPGDRRFHHQTICCPVCGPKYGLFGKDGKPIPAADPIAAFARLLSEGGIGVIKGWGGMHICCTLPNTHRMREWYGRMQKPFAIMVRSADAVGRYGIPTDDESAHLASPQRPIVLIKKNDRKLTDGVSPGLDNIGVFLPYSGAQHLLFRALDGAADALVMTSANPPGEPMALTDSDALRLGADMYLFHDQRITNRADDSVLRVFDGRTSFIRRSRGHVPSFMPIGLKGCAAGVGAQENLTGSVAFEGRIHPTQHIGDGDGIGVPEYLEAAVRSQMKLLGCIPQAVAADLHPGCSNRRFAKGLAEESGAEFVEVQHHWAHAASLIVDNIRNGVSEQDDVLCLALDGNGRGDDGNSWGGEVLLAGLGSYKRVAHLEYVPLLGSEKALHDLRRLRFAIDAMNSEENRSFTDAESAILMKMMGGSVGSSSMGRLMDTLAYSLGVCGVRTYDGEPAMKLEPLLAAGRLIPGFEARTSDGTVMTAELFSRIGDQRPADIAYSVVHNVMKELVDRAVEAADSEGVRSIGITGGASYNSSVCRMFSELASGRGHELIFHRNVPNGDGGISAGQTAVALKRIS
ncbi:MAG: carbamoyltransferase HypF [Candidatus Methanoplasma sp.]|jgi:hydrogenase maturation protein HypF|nr:carbamoyltransferase HypF [Candidatus Methanoplasma sp.]